jgi:phosphoribosylanthranilate isomerase
MTWVKICGTTNLEDALTAVDAGADAVGFVFYEKSPRNISVEAARAIVERLPEGVEKIGVFVHGDEPSPLKVFQEAGLTGTQSYVSVEIGDRRSIGGALAVSSLPRHARFLTALPMRLVGGDEDIQKLASNFAKLRKSQPEGAGLPEGLMDTIVLDSGDLRSPGGTGKTFDWERAVPIAQGMRQGGLKLVVAGGLTPHNVAEAIGILQPWGVDVASGVEAEPGKKDPAKVRAFVKAVREMDEKVS